MAASPDNPVSVCGKAHARRRAHRRRPSRSTHVSRRGSRHDRRADRPTDATGMDVHRSTLSDSEGMRLLRLRADLLCQKQKHQDTELNHLVRQLWEVDGHSHLAPARQLLTKPEAEAVQRVERSCTVIDGRYQVTLPWKDDAEQTSLPDSYPMALRRLEHTERRLRRDPEIAESYSRTIRQYADKGYIVKAEHDSDQPAWYLPHFAVLRPDKETTKTRIVFDASAAVDGVSLNSRLHAGPKLQRDLVEVLTRFRKKPVAARLRHLRDVPSDFSRTGPTPVPSIPVARPGQRPTARCVRVSTSRLRRQRIPVLGAVRHTQQHARTNADTLPLAADAVLSPTYMDDTMTSVEDSPHRPPTVRRADNAMAESRAAREEVAVQLNRRPRRYPSSPTEWVNSAWTTESSYRLSRHSASCGNRRPTSFRTAIDQSTLTQQPSQNVRS